MYENAPYILLTNFSHYAARLLLDLVRGLSHGCRPSPIYCCYKFA